MLKRINLLIFNTLLAVSLSLPSLAFDSSGQFRILSLDGGGVRGVIPATILSDLENATGKPITELFDMIVGTSTGGLIALYLNIPGSDGQQKFTSKEIIQIYKDLSATIFKNPLSRRLRTLGGLISSKYSAKPFEALLQEPRYFGSIDLKKAVKPVMVTSKNINTGEDFIFSSLDAEKNDAANFPMWVAARSTSAAPTYFKPLEVKVGGQTKVLVDGGVGANNPALKGVLHARAHFPDAKIVMLSIGTGISDKVLNVESKGLLAGGIAQILSPTIQTLFSAQEKDSSDAVMAIIGSGNFYRVAPIIADKYAEMDNVEPANLNMLEQIGQETAKNHEVYNRALCNMFGVKSRCK